MELLSPHLFPVEFSSTQWPMVADSISIPPSTTHLTLASLAFYFLMTWESNLNIVDKIFQASIELNDGITAADGLEPG
jgi:hypothetical protein